MYVVHKHKKQWKNLIFSSHGGHLLVTESDLADKKNRQQIVSIFRNDLVAILISPYSTTIKYLIYLKNFSWPISVRNGFYSNHLLANEDHQCVALLGQKIRFLQYQNAINQWKFNIENEELMSRSYIKYGKFPVVNDYWKQKRILLDGFFPCCALFAICQFFQSDLNFL